MASNFELCFKSNTLVDAERNTLPIVLTAFAGQFMAYIAILRDNFVTEIV